MEVLNPRSALLSNYEVLSLLRELESDNLLRTKAAFRVKKEEETLASNGGTGSLPASGNPHLEASENLRTIEVEAISYLSADYLPTTSQTEEGITKLVKSLSPSNLTKAEKLQIINLAPTLPVELYVIVEELEDRFGDRIDDILENVQTSLTPAAKDTVQLNGISGQTVLSTGAMTVQEDEQWDEDADAIYDEEVFDDTGAGIGVEGDLEMDDE
ncbi:RNA polymerase Rpb4-domain-containing protein [Flammula alnicola]|nr:RNA polymerase Rpb4-domain-containing protein [Flammula alnicola]